MTRNGGGFVSALANMMLTIATLGSLMSMAVVVMVMGQDQTRFVAPGTRVEEYKSSNGALLRQYTTTLYYSDEYGSGGGREAMRLDTPFPNTAATNNASHSDLRIYEDRFLRFTWCSGIGTGTTNTTTTPECGWEDLFPQQLPRMWCPSSGIGGTTPASQAVNGVPATDLIEFQTSGGGGGGGTTTVITWCRVSTNVVVGVLELRPAADDLAIYYFPDEGQLDASPAAFNDTVVFTVPAFCPVVDSSCFRLDLYFVLDHSGSIGESWSRIVSFTADLIDQLSVSEQDFKVGVLRYYGGSGCVVPNVGNYTTVISDLTTDKAQLLQTLTSPTVLQLGPPCTQGCPLGGCNTATVKGITTALNALNGPEARPATNKAVVVITDGNGNNPASPLTFTLTSLAYAPDEWMQGISDCASCGSCNPACREARHDDWMCVMYRQKWNDTGPTIYAVGVPDDPAVLLTCSSGGLSCGTLNRIALNDGGDCPGWWPDAGGSLDTTAVHDRAYLVESYDALGDVTFSIAEALTCPNPGATPCPNDCRPGGFCCAGVCVCLDDCTASHPGDSCQSGICATTTSGTQCVAVGSPCSSSDDPTGIIVGSVLGGLAACLCLFCALAAAAALVALLYRKNLKDFEAWEDAFSKGESVQDSALYQEKNTSVTSPLYVGDGGGE